MGSSPTAQGDPWQNWDQGWNNWGTGGAAGTSTPASGVGGSAPPAQTPSQGSAVGAPPPSGGDAPLVNPYASSPAQMAPNTTPQSPAPGVGDNTPTAGQSIGPMQVTDPGPLTGGLGSLPASPTTSPGGVPGTPNGANPMVQALQNPDPYAYYKPAGLII